MPDMMIVKATRTPVVLAAVACADRSDVIDAERKFMEFCRVAGPSNGDAGSEQ
jgi:hypothetical protein